MVLVTVKYIDTKFLYITEASDENGNKLRYAGIEFSGAANMIQARLPGLAEQSLLFRQTYHNTFGRDTDELMLQTIPKKVFVVLPYADAEKLFLSGKHPVKISRVVVSALAFRGGSIFNESQVVLSGVLGIGEIRGSGGHLDATVRTLAAEIQKAFKSHVYLRSKQVDTV